MTEFWKIFATAVLTAFASNLFGYIKEKRTASSKYTEQVLTELYVPIYKILVERIIPGDGYEGIDQDQLDSIKDIIDDNPELTDPILEGLIYGYLEDAYWNVTRIHADQQDPRFETYDSDRRLLDYILISFNKTRRPLGLPHPKEYAFQSYLK
ncbi:hypothetical protein [Metabacillus sp. Hm71]|uniref:hypothetical protein n=1 Tax=Metabacillus sp. Hm71 TaxID=3450743 RepID=UPI003F42789E